MSPTARVVRWLALLAWMLVITYWSDQPTLPIDQPEIAQLLLGTQHKLAHLVAFGTLGLLAWWAMQGWRRAALLAVLLAPDAGKRRLRRR